MLRNMEYVYAVYQKRSFSKAAEALHLSQPALSTAIRKIEGEIRLPLFDRRTNPITLTAAGEYYIASIEKIMAIEEEMEQHFSRMIREQRTVINVGSSSYFCTYVLPGLVEEFRRSCPDVAVNVMEANASEFAGLFQSDILDLCLTVDRLEAENEKLRGVPWKREEIMLAVPARLPVVGELEEYRLSFAQVRNGAHLDPGAPAVGLERFREVPFLFLKNGNDLHQRAGEMCRRAGFIPQVSMYLDQLLTAYYVACSGKGAAFIRADLVEQVEPTNQVCFFKLKDPLAQRDVMLYDRGQGLSPAAREFRSFLLEKTGHK